MKRVITVARRPTPKEVELIARVSGIGILIVGGVAFLIQILGRLTDQFFQGGDEESASKGITRSLSMISILLPLLQSLDLQFFANLVVFAPMIDLRLLLVLL